MAVPPIGEITMKNDNEHLGTLALGYLWNQPVQQLNHLLDAQHPEHMPDELLSALRKLTAEEKQAFKRAITAIFADEITRLLTALDSAGKRGETLEIHEGDRAFARHLPPWENHLSYFDREGNPKTAAA
jgi:hypothetical protein